MPACTKVGLSSRLVFVTAVFVLCCGPGIRGKHYCTEIPSTMHDIPRNSWKGRPHLVMYDQESEVMPRFDSQKTRDLARTSFKHDLNGVECRRHCFFSNSPIGGSRPSLSRRVVRLRLRGGGPEATTAVDKAKQRAAERSAKFKEWVAEQKKKSEGTQDRPFPSDCDSAPPNAFASGHVAMEQACVVDENIIESRSGAAVTRARVVGADDDMQSEAIREQQHSSDQPTMSFTIYAACLHPTAHAILISHAHSEVRERLKQGHICLALDGRDILDDLGYLCVTVLPVSSAAHQDVVPAAEYAAEQQLEALTKFSNSGATPTSLFPRIKVLSECLRQVGHVTCVAQPPSSPAKNKVHWKISSALSEEKHHLDAATDQAQTHEDRHWTDDAWKTAVSVPWTPGRMRSNLASSQAYTNTGAPQRQERGGKSDSRDAAEDELVASQGAHEARWNEGKSDSAFTQHGYSRYSEPNQVATPSRAANANGGSTAAARNRFSGYLDDQGQTATPSRAGNERKYAGVRYSFAAEEFSSPSRPERYDDRETEMLSSVVAGKNRERVRQMYDGSRDVKAYLSSARGGDVDANARDYHRTHQEPIAAEARIDVHLRDDDICLDKLINFQCALDVVDRRTPSPVRRMINTPSMSRYVFLFSNLLLE
jgi:hypothetical protein